MKGRAVRPKYTVAMLNQYYNMAGFFGHRSKWSATDRSALHAEIRRSHEWLEQEAERIKWQIANLEAIDSDLRQEWQEIQKNQKENNPIA